MLRAAIIGHGEISKAHRKAFWELEKSGKAKLVCACDIDPDAFERNKMTERDIKDSEFTENIGHYTELEKMLSDQELDLINICIPTDLHCEISVRMLERGYHVLCEKPMALSYGDCQRMLNAAAKSKKELMVGQCVRFYPAYDYIKLAIDEGSFGKVIGAHFSRLGPTPSSEKRVDNWFIDPKRSGGCITDLHIHDVDLIRYLFGEPEAVCSRASSSVCVYDTVHSSFKYGDIPVTAIADWSMTGFKFSARSLINLERATIAFDGRTVTVYPKDGKAPYEAELKNESGHFGEISYFCDVIEGKLENTKNTAQSAALTVKMIEKLKESIMLGGEYLLWEEGK